MEAVLLPHVIKGTVREMESTKESSLYDEAIRLAESLVRSEMRLAQLKSLNAPEGCISAEREIVGGRMEHVMCSELAERFLPQARTVLAMRQHRLDYLYRNTYLGQCHDRLDGLFVELAHSETIDADIESRGQALDALEAAIRAGNRGNISAALVTIFEFIVNDFTFAKDELPPLPPLYQVPK